MARFAVRRGVSAHDCPGETEIRTVGLEHTVRVQPSRFRRQRSVRAKSPGRHGP